MSLTISEALYGAIDAQRSCIKQNLNFNWTPRIEQIMGTAPRGAGFDNGTTLDYDRSFNQKLVFQTDFHHMDHNGFYIRWSHYVVRVKPTFTGLDIHVRGHNRNEIIEDIADRFNEWLTSPAPEWDHPVKIQSPNIQTE